MTTSNASHEARSTRHADDHRAEGAPVDLREALARAADRAPTAVRRWLAALAADQGDARPATTTEDTS
jgi:hypothetical protein